MSQRKHRPRTRQKSFRVAYGRDRFHVLLERYMRRNPSLGPRQVGAQVAMDMQETAQAAARLTAEMAGIVAAATGAPIRGDDPRLVRAVFELLREDVVWFARGEPEFVERVTQFLLRLAARLLSGSSQTLAIDEAPQHVEPGLKINVVRSTSGACLELTSSRDKS